MGGKRLSDKENMVDLVYNLKGTTENTIVKYDKNTVKYAPHDFKIYDVHNDNVLQNIHFQHDPVKVAGVNGIFNEDLLIIVIERLMHFQQTEFACNENNLAIKEIDKALDLLRHRTEDRRQRGVLGTYEK